MEAAFPIDESGNPSTVFRCIATGSILVLKWSSIILYLLVCIDEIVAPVLIRVLYLFPTCTVAVVQAHTGPIVNWLVDDCPLHSSESLLLLEEGSCV